MANGPEKGEEVPLDNSEGVVVPSPQAFRQRTMEARSLCRLDGQGHNNNK